MAIEIIKHSDDASWLALRAQGIGSSEVGTILGVNKWQTPYSLWLQKTGQAPATKTNIAMRVGHELESFVAQLYEEQTGNVVDKTTEGNWSIRNDMRPYTIASPDRICKAKVDGHDILLECKTTQIAVDYDNIPPYWFCQVQYLLACSGLEDGAIAWLVGNHDFGTKRIVKDENFLTWMFERLDKFWKDCIVGGMPPEVVNVADVEAMFPHPVAGKAITADAIMASKIDALRDKQKTYSSLKKEIDGLKDDVRMYMTDANSLLVYGKVAATLSEYTSNRLDTERLKSERPDIYEAYSKTISTTTLRIK